MNMVIESRTLVGNWTYEGSARCHECNKARHTFRNVDTQRVQVITTVNRG